MTAHTSTGAGAPAYRADIDGLRAIAVLVVVLFHAFPALLPGGFVGVDIFFVISGFLITSILLADFDADRFSIFTFYARRIRRIFPALITLLIFVCVVGWFCLFGDEYRALGKDVVAGAAFVANLVTWSEVGYFDRAAEAKPLLHLWSLGVEEQFYIVWPLVLALTHKSRARLFVAALCILVVSFVVNIMTIGMHPTAAFFSPLSRFWELMAGCLLAASSRFAQRVPPWWRSVLSVVGLALLVGAVAALNSRSQFPGWSAITPVCGAVLLLWAGPRAIVNRTLLSLPPMVWIGKISYPLYLWHWPLLSFTTIVAGQTPAAPMRVALVIASILLAWGTYVFIEKPIRFGRSRTVSVVLPCAVLLAVAGCGTVAHTYDFHSFGDKHGSGPDPATAKNGDGVALAVPLCGVPDADKALFACAQDGREPARIVLWGDSKALALYWGVLRESTPGNRWRLLARAGCAPVTGVFQTWWHAGAEADDCRKTNQIALQTISADPHVQLVVLATATRVVMTNTFYKADGVTPDPAGAFNGLDATIVALERAGKRVALIEDNPTVADPKSCLERRIVGVPVAHQLVALSRYGTPEKCSISYTRHLEVTKQYRAEIAALKSRHPEILVYDASAALCDKSKDVCPESVDGKFLYADQDHLSDVGNGLVARQLLPQIDGFMRQ